MTNLKPYLQISDIAFERKRVIGGTGLALALKNRTETKRLLVTKKALKIISKDFYVETVSMQLVLVFLKLSDKRLHFQSTE